MSSLISIVAPAFNEESILREFHRRTAAILRTLPFDYEIVFVNDGSQDGTLTVMEELHRDDPRIAIVDLSRNFGKEIAITAGIDHTCGEAVIVIDTDLQHPPELIPTLIERWREGYDVVYAQRTRRDDETLVKRVMAEAFYRLMKNLGSVRLPMDAGDYRLLSRRAVEALKRLPERHRFMKGLFAWIGFRQIAVPFTPDQRTTGATKWSYWRLFNLSIEGITSFTIAPLRIATLVGVATSVLAFGYALWIILQTLIFGEVVRGFPTIMIAILFLGGVQLLALGVIGEYLGRIFNETKQRPLYLVQSVMPSEPAQEIARRPDGDEA